MLPSRNEAGQEIQLRIKKGSQGEPSGEVLPEGYSWVDPTATTTEEVTTTPTTVETARVEKKTPTEKPDDGLGPGGGRIGMGGFSQMELAVNKMLLLWASHLIWVKVSCWRCCWRIKTGLSLALGKPIPAEATATFTYDNQTYTVSGAEYNNLKESGYTGDLADKIVA